MATATFGTLKEFNSDNESVKSYLERVDLYFRANSVEEDKQVPILLSSIGSATYTLLSDLLAPATPGTKSLEVITTTLRKHYEPKRAVIAERFHFHKRDQAVGESIMEYDAALRKLAIHCTFGTYFEEALRDRFVCGLRNEAMQRRLLSETDLTLTRAMELALGMETAEHNTRAFKGTDATIKKIRGGPSQHSYQQRPCFRCGKSGHSPADCRFRDADCHNCGKKGHIAPACMSKSKAQYKAVTRYSKPKFQGTNLIQQDVQQDDNNTDSEEESFHLFKLAEPSSNTIEITVDVEGQLLRMEVDTGAAVSIISDKTRQDKFPHLKLWKSRLVLKTYTDEPMHIMGQLNVHVTHNMQMVPLVLVVVAGEGPSLFGRNWLKYIQLDWKRIATVHIKSPNLEMLLQKYEDLFNEELGTIQPQKATLHVETDATPRFFRPRPVPFAIKTAVGQELDRLEKQGVLRKVERSDWAAPIVVVPKKDGKFRICGDYKVTINRALAVDQYPLPKPEDLFATLANGKKFTKLDLSQAYQQLLLDEASSLYVTINTHQGLYQYTRLPFGIASAPAMFQRLMDTVLQGIPGVICYIDDILITGKDEKEHLQRLEEVLQCLAKHGFRLKKPKCRFMASSVEYLGHQIDQHGIQAIQSKVDAIKLQRMCKSFGHFLG